MSAALETILDIKRASMTAQVADYKLIRQRLDAARARLAQAEARLAAPARAFDSISDLQMQERWMAAQRREAARLRTVVVGIAREEATAAAALSQALGEVRAVERLMPDAAPPP